MICTVEEAKNTWCPSVRISGISNNKKHYFHTYNRWINPNGKIVWYECCCLANACMAWCWHDKKSGRGYCGFGSKPNE